MKKYIALLIVLSILNMSGCSSGQGYEDNGGFASVADDSLQEDVSSSIASSVSETSIIENYALISSGLKDALSEDTVFGVKIYVNQPPDRDLSAKTVETFKHEDALTYLYIVPRYAGSSIIIEGLGFDESRNEFVPTGLLFKSVCTEDYALLVQADLPEAGLRLRITVSYEEITASYDPVYDGRGDTVYPYVKNGVLLDEAPFSEATGSTTGNEQDSFETAIARFDENEIVVDSVYADPLKNVDLLKVWVTDYQQGKPGKVAVLMDGLGFPSYLYVFESDGSKAYTITCYRSKFGDGPSEIPPPSIYQSSLIIERAYDYVFGADYPADSQGNPLVIHNRAVPAVEEMDWNPDTDKPFDEFSMEQAVEVAKGIQERLYRYMTIIPGFYSGGYYLRESVLNAASDYSGPDFHYRVTGAIKIDGNPFYVVYWNQEKEALERDEHSGNVVAISEDGKLAFIQSMVDGRWTFVEDKDEKAIIPAK